MKKLLLVFGTRPEAIKMAPLVIEFKKYPKEFETLVCVTGQHRQMLDQVLNLFEIVPDYDLNIMMKGQDLYDITTRVLMGMREVLIQSKPDVVFVHGDTTTSTISSLAAFYQQIPVAHIEAGLRTHNIFSPWPEEMNRQLTGRLATYHFAPTILSKNNLMLENVSTEAIIVTGNTVIDALHSVLMKIDTDTTVENSVLQSLELAGFSSERMKSARRIILITGHRRENFGQGFNNICKAIKTLSETFKDVDFVYPMHLNPNVRNAVNEVFEGKIYDNVFLIEPLDYLPFIYLMNKSSFLLTDSGGIQEEAPGLGKPVLVMRDTTERPEAVIAGTVKLVGTDEQKIINFVSDLLLNDEIYQKMAQANNPYGDGHASKRIVDYFLNS